MLGITTRSALSKFIANQNALASGDASERTSGPLNQNRVAVLLARSTDQGNSQSRFRFFKRTQCRLRHLTPLMAVTTFARGTPTH